MKDSAEKVKRALEEAQRAQTAVTTAIQQASADIQNTNDLLSSVSTVTSDMETFTGIANMTVTFRFSALCLGRVKDRGCRTEAT